MAISNTLWLISCLVLLPATGSFATPPVRLGDYAIGADLSFLADAESHGRIFKDQGQVLPALQIFHNHGYNWIRLRLFHTPKQLPNDLAYTLQQAKQAKALGFRLLLNLHYSDTWADPAKQFLPQAWEGQTHAELKRSVFDYTRDTLAAFCAAGVRPDMVQIGNEVISGMLWPDGRLPDHWPEFAELLKAGVAGVKAGCESGPQPRIMLHIDRGADRSGSQHFFDNCLAHHVEFDIIGQSYYPWWHGSLIDLQRNLSFLANRYDRDIVLVEVAYNWRPAEYPHGGAPFPETPAGQREFLEEVHRIVMATPNEHGAGIFWWEPAVRLGPLASRGMFDDEGNALPVLSALDRHIRGRRPRVQAPNTTALAP